MALGDKLNFGVELRGELCCARCGAAVESNKIHVCSKEAGNEEDETEKQDG